VQKRLRQSDERGKGVKGRLNRRTAYILALLLVGVLVLSNVVSLLWDQPQAGRQRSSLAPSRTGHKAYYELLREASFTVRRNHALPGTEASGHGAFFVIGPRGGLLERDPGYLADLGDWAAEGHTLLVAFGSDVPLARLAFEERTDEADEQAEPRRDGG